MTESEQNFQSKGASLRQSPMNAPHVIILVAAGKGVRAGGGLPKQYRRINGEALIAITIKYLCNAYGDVPILPVIAEGTEVLFEEATAHLNANILEPVTGGVTRQASVLRGLDALEPYKPKFVHIHDAARPFVTEEVANELKTKLENGADGVLPTLTVTDTIKQSLNNQIEATLDRTILYRAQTPQAFPYETIKQAHQSSNAEATDDCQLIELSGGRVEMVKGDTNLFKVTNVEDFRKVRSHMMLERPDIRVGTGYDVHRLGDGDFVTLGGIEIPHDKGLIGHSDADVLLHALTDAILGAISEGDIGQHFPPSDAQWKGAPSDIFLARARDLIAEKDGLIAHVSAVIIAEKPKMAPYMVAMRTNIAQILRVSQDRVSLQATTSEKLGFTGREEGIAVQASATVRLPLSEDE